MSDEGFSVEPVSDAPHPRVQGDLFLPSDPSGWGELFMEGIDLLDQEAAPESRCLADPAGPKPRSWSR